MGKKSKKKKVKMIIPIFIVLLVTIFSMILIIGSNSSNKDKINKNVYVNDVNVGEMTKEQAKNILNEKFNKNLADKNIKMLYGKRVFIIDFKALKAHYDINSAVDIAFNHGKDNNVFKNFIRNIGLDSHKYNVTLKFVADTSIVEGRVKRIAKKVDIAPVDAQISYANKVFTTIPEKSGLVVDKKELAKLIKESINPNEDEIKIQIPTLVAEARIKQGMLSKIDTEISAFTTSFNTFDAARSGNIRIAAQAVDGTVILPGEIFSMNKEVGPRVASKGYQEAHVIINGELVQGLAGGICQATTTVYNAALLGNFEIVQRRGHGLKVGYVKAGRDATISGDYIDFKFKNTNKYPIYLHTIIKNGTVTAIIYGANEHPNQTVKIESKVLETITPPDPLYVADPTLPEGTKKVESKAIYGLKSIAYRKVYESGVLVKTEVLSKDKYKAARAKILVGTKQSTD